MDDLFDVLIESGGKKYQTLTRLCITHKVLMKDQHRVCLMLLLSFETKHFFQELNVL